MAKSSIIKKLACGEVDSEIALNQLKLLLYEFPDQRISSWIERELKGYNLEDEVPSYRKTVGALKGSILNYHIHASNVGIPLRADTPAEISDFCNEVVLREPIRVIRELAAKSENISITVPPDFYPYIIKYSLMPITAVLNANVIIPSTAALHILTVVNNKILDILLLLEKEFGSLDNLDIDLGSKTEEEIQTIQKSINIYIYNDQNISIGNNNKISDTTIASGSSLGES